jgi:hypothetical protein
MANAKIFVFTFVLLFHWQAWSAEPMSIKGLQLGQSPEVACATSVLGVNELDKPLRTLQDDYPGLRITNSLGCDVAIETFAGQQLENPASLLFADDRLIQVKFEMQTMDFGQLADFIVALRQSYGKTSPYPKDPNGVFSHTVWKQGTQALAISWAKKQYIEFNGIEVFLRDEAAFAKWQKDRKFNEAVLDRGNAKRRALDTK